jgi:hypothetical protein
MAPVGRADAWPMARGGSQANGIAAWASAIALIVAMAAVLAARIGLGSASGTANAVITPASAREVLADVWAQRELARTEDNPAAIEAIDTGPELTRDMGITREAQDEGVWSQRVQRPFGPSAVFVPYQTSYPASFLAAVQTTSQWSSSPASDTPEGLATALLVLTKASASAPWRVAMETRYEHAISQTDVGLDLGALGASEAFDPPPPRPGWTSAAKAISGLAGFYQHYAEYGDAPAQSEFGHSPWTTGQGERIAEGGLNGQIDAKGFRNSVTYDADPAADGLYQFDVGGDDLVCGTVRGVETALPARPGGYLSQPRSRHNWGGWLAPGAYSKITSPLIHQVCLVVPPDGYEGIRAISGDDEGSSWNTTGTLLFSYPGAALPGEAQ